MIRTLIHYMANSLYRPAGGVSPIEPTIKLNAVLQSFHQDHALVLHFDTERGRLILRVDQHHAEQLSTALLHYLKPFQFQTEDGRPQDLPGSPSLASSRPSETS